MKSTNPRLLCPAVLDLGKEEFLRRSAIRPFIVEFTLVGGPKQIARLTGSERLVHLIVKAGSGQIDFNRHGHGTANFFGFVNGDPNRSISFTIGLDCEPKPKGSIQILGTGW